ncbi:hypothetical protein CNMCM5793_005717 [Aspergillus hiratsukae]|uniref:Short chain dehydrogenase/reductase n=1 Tax=Aspergillus hiratsukae TaxID=1194566 RepID=A0A8H6PGN7_9EURO|nr:hypothetical protein CNMCM5793_005717 [Aspergillus hiratsukae]KAF7172061.1 hypothetical protein CNMCM6106_006354 [Aspergillus hiratsukae]
MLQISEQLKTPFSYIGAATVSYLAVQVARHFYCYLRPSSLSRYNPPGKDAWALVTGASDGIGFGFAQELCKRGFNIFLHGRNHDKLLSKRDELLAEFPHAKVRIIVFDAFKSDEDLSWIAQEIGDARLTVLVNNAGGGLNPFKRLAELTHEDVQATINLNNTFAVQITRVLMPILEKNGPSLILTISSAAAYGMPTLAVYSGSKGFVDSFTRSLQAEVTLDGKDVDVLGLRVGNTKSQGNDVAVGLFSPTSRTLASAALNRVGCDRPVVWAYWPHSLQGLSFHLIPRNVLIRILGGHLRDMKREAEAKQAKKR